MLSKPFQQIFVPSIPGRDYQEESRECPSQGGGSSGGSTPTPGARCTTVYTYGPPSPYDHQPTVTGYRTICT